ncbi:MAG: SpoIIE family protein phosphatase [Bacteroidota bacterium]|nr:SpoIIE family protein phosphatase [Bacteroidota bacterium]
MGQSRLDQAMRLGKLDITDGLSQGMVFCMFQDSRGFMWFGTKEGLNRFDGHEFRVYRKRVGDSTSLPDNYVYAITEDHRGRFWLGTGGSGLVMFDPERESFVRIPLTLEGGDVPVRNVDDVSVDNYGGLWLSIQGSRLLRLDIRSADPLKIASSARFEAPLRRHASREVNRLRFDRFDRLWYISDQGLFMLDAEHGKWDRKIDAAPLLSDASRQGALISMAVAEDSSYWVLRADQADSDLFRITVDGRHVLSRTRMQIDLQPEYIRDILDGPGDILYVLSFKYLIRYNTRTGNFIAGEEDRTREAAYSGHGNQLLRSRDGMIWISTSGYGLNTFDPMTLSFNARKGSINDALFGKEIAAFDRHIRARTAGFAGLATSAYPLRLENGDVWCGTRDHGLLFHDASSGRVRQYGTVPDDPFSGMMIRLQRPFVDRRERIWVGNRHGISRLDPVSGQWHHFWYAGDMPDLTDIDDPITCYHEDRDGMLWVGTMRRGLGRFSPQTGEFTFYGHDDKDPLSISHDHVLTIEADPLHPHRYLWVGTDGGGLNRFDMSAQIFERFDESSGLPSSVVYGILTDATGSLWMSTNEGLAQMDPRTRLLRRFDVRDGLQGNEFNRTEYYRVGDSLCFGGVDGHNRFLPASVRSNTVIPNVVLTGLRLFNTPVNLQTPETPLRAALPYARSITLPHERNMISIEFAALDFHAPDKNRYRYRLVGLDEKWIEAGTERMATFTNLGPGEYEFQVLGANNHEVWNTTGATLKIVILPPWYLTGWAFAIYIILFVALLRTVDRFQKKRLLRREREQSQFREARLRAEAAELEARAVRAENERKQKEMQVAAVIQQRVLPQQLPKIPGYDIAAINLPADEIGGDYYDCIALSDGRVAMVIADVTGKGVPASLLVNSLHAALRVHLDHNVDIISLVKRLNSFLYASTPPNAFITFFIAVLDPSSGDLEIVNAGHNPALRHFNGSLQESTHSRNLPLGCVGNGVPYHSERCTLAPGEGLLLFTDGITEAMNRQWVPFGQEPLEALVLQHSGSPASMMLGHIVAELRHYADGAEQSDDVTALYVRRMK